MLYNHHCEQYHQQVGPLILLVDSDHHSDSYVTIIVVNANKILVLPISFFCQSQPLYLDFAGNDWPAQQSQGELFA